MPSNTCCGVESAGSLEVAAADCKQNATIKTIVEKEKRTRLNRILITKEGSILPFKSAACGTPDWPRLLLDSLQQKCCADKSHDRAEQHHDEINSVKGGTRLIQIHQAKSPTKMRERENLRHSLNEGG